MNKTAIKTASTVLLLAVVAGALFLFTPIGNTLSGKLGGFDRGHFEAVVAQVRSMSLAAGEEVQLRLDDPSDPTSLRYKVNPTPNKA